MDIDEIINIPPYSLRKKEKEKILNPFLSLLSRNHYDSCSSYKKMMDGVGYKYKKYYNYNQLPFLPVRLFKMFDLLSANKKEIIKTCNYWSNLELPLIMNPESRLDAVYCEKGAFIFTINLFEYLSNLSTNTKVLDALNSSFLYGVNNNDDFSPFRNANWQIAYLFYDKNKKYLFALVYDKNVNKVDKYFRNVGVELGLNMNLKN